MTDSIISMLRADQAEWAGAEVRTGGFLPVNQRYPMKIVEAFLDKPKDKNYLQVVYKLQVISGEYENRKTTKKSILKTADNKEFVKGELHTLKATIPTDYTELGKILENEVTGKYVEVFIQESKDKEGKPDEFPPKIYFQQLLEEQPNDVASKVVKKVKKKVAPKEEPTLTKEEVIQMGKDDNEEALQAVIDKHGLNIDQNDYDVSQYAEIADLIVDQLGL